jgi:hypothetical protein
VTLAALLVLASPRPQLARASSGAALLATTAAPSARSDTWLNATAFSDLQAAVDACPSGGTLFIPAGRHRVPAGGLVISKPIAVRGEPGTHLVAHAAAAREPVIRIETGGAELSGVQLFDLKLEDDVRPDSLRPGNYGVQCNITAPGGKVSELLLERVTAINLGDDGFHLHGLGSGDRVFVFVMLRNVNATLCRGAGFHLQVAAMVSFSDCYFNSNDGCGVEAEQAEVAFSGCAFENNCHSPTMDRRWGGQVYLRGCSQNRFEACHWEQFATPAQPRNKRALTLLGADCSTVSNCTFTNAVEDPDPGARGIYCTHGDAPGRMALVILPNRFDNVRTAIEIDSTATGMALDCVIYPQFIRFGTGAMILPADRAKSGLVMVGRAESKK